MKKLILMASVLLVAKVGSAQVICLGVSPAPIVKNYDFTWGDPAGGDWGSPDFTVAGTYVEDTLIMVNDGTPGTNATYGNLLAEEGCNASSANAYAGKIAVIRRNTCEFGAKAKKAQDAGAIAVIIVNRDADVIEMGGGLDGANVTIPVIMLNNSDGNSLIAQMLTDDVVMFIGNKFGMYANDLSIYDNKSLRADFGSIPAMFAQNASELSVPLGSWAFNYGQNNQTGVTLTTTVEFNGTELYNESSPTENVLSGDSIFLQTPNFSLSTYPAGKYDVKYTLQFGTADDFDPDNMVMSSFYVSDSVWSLARLDSADIIRSDAFYRPATLPSESFRPCIVLKDAHASRAKVTGLYFGGFTVGTSDTAAIPTLEGLSFEAIVYTWNDPDGPAASATFNELSDVAIGVYEYNGNYQDSTLFAEFSPALELVDNQRYLVCVNNYEPRLFMAFSTSDYYDQNAITNDRTRFPAFSNDIAVNNNGKGFEIAPSIGLKVAPNDVGITENMVESAAFPNPANEQVTVMLNASGNAVLTIADLSGRVVSSETVKVANGKFTANVAGMNAGSYVFSMEFENGSKSQFKVVVAK